MSWREIARRGQRFCPPETVVFLALWLSLMVGVRTRLFRDPGTFWHTAVGERILTTGRFFDTDPYSFTFGGQTWIPHQWLAECSMALVHRAAGLDGLLLATVTAIAALYAWLAHRLIRRGLHPIPATLVVVLALLAGAMHFHVRPHIGTIVLFGLMLGLLCDFEAGRIGMGRLAWLLPLFLFWTNWHGGMLGGLATLGLAVAGWLLVRLLGRESPAAGPRQAALLVGLVMACGLTAFVNPYGDRLPRAWFAIMGSPLLPRVIEEHMPLRPNLVEFWIVGLLVSIYGAALAGTWPRWPRVSWLLPLPWLILGLSRVRNVPLFAVAAVVVLAEILPHSRVSRWLARPGRDLFDLPGSDREPRRGLGWRPLALPIAVVLMAVACQVAGLRVPVIGRGWARLPQDRWPVALLTDLRRIEAESPDGARVFNDYNLGGFLIYFTPRIRVFIDDRCELYGDAWLAEYEEAQRVRPERIEAWAERYHVAYALVQSGGGFDRYLRREPAWDLVTRTEAASLYRLAVPRRPADVIAQ